MFAIRFRHIFTTIVLSMASLNLYAESGREDYDLDDDGLIEINDLADLDEIRNMPNGSSLYGESVGCPESGCNGFELTSDLDFDTNGDGVMDERDTYWNGGLGWEPIQGSVSSVKFPIQFDGNGHVIANLYINRSGSNFIGLFSDIYESSLRNLSMIGALTSVSGSMLVGILVGSVVNSEITDVYISGKVSGSIGVGGVIGRIRGGNILNILSSANVMGVEQAGGLIGLTADSSSTADSVISQALAIGPVHTNDTGGGLLADYYFSEPTIQNSYWSTDTTGQEASVGDNPDLNYVGATLAELQCPTAADNTTCAPDKTLYAEWSSDAWDFGTNQQLPALKINGRVFRDSDGDGTLDENPPPSVSLRLTQDGNEEVTIVAGEGDVTLEASVSDLDEFESYTLEWSLNGISNTVELGNTITFKSDDLVAGDYTLRVTATDSGYPRMSGSDELVVRVISDLDQAPSSGSKGGGGSLSWYWLLLAAGLLRRREKLAV